MGQCHSHVKPLRDEQQRCELSGPGGQGGFERSPSAKKKRKIRSRGWETHLKHMPVLPLMGAVGKEDPGSWRKSCVCPWVARVFSEQHRGPQEAQGTYAPWMSTLGEGREFPATSSLPSPSLAWLTWHQLLRSIISSPSIPSSHFIWLSSCLFSLYHTGNAHSL